MSRDLWRHYLFAGKAWHEDDFCDEELWCVVELADGCFVAD